MSLLSFFSLFFAMLVLAMTPGPGVFTVIASALNQGFRQTIAVVAGIICGDYVFILLVLSGLQVLAAQLGTLFVLFKYAGAAYLVWLGLGLWRNRPEPGTPGSVTGASHLSGFLTGLVVTLGNPKAIFFYLSFFPAFLDPAELGATDVLVILLLVTFVLAGTMLGYAWLACSASNFLSHPQRGKRLKQLAGSLLIGSGAMLAVRT